MAGFYTRNFEACLLHSGGLYVNQRLMLRSLEALNGFSKARQYFKCIANNTVVCSFKERRFSIGVDDYNYFRTVDTSEVLDGSGDTCCNVKIWANSHTSLPYVFVVRAQSDVGNGARTSGGCAKGSG